MSNKKSETPAHIELDEVQLDAAVGGASRELIPCIKAVNPCVKTLVPCIKTVIPCIKVAKPG